MQTILKILWVMLQLKWKIVNYVVNDLRSKESGKHP